MNDPYDPLNRPLSYVPVTEPLPEWVHTVNTIGLYTVGVLAAFFMLIFIVAVFRDQA